MQTLVNGVQTYVKISGQGEDALLLHGVPDSANLWDKVIPLINHQYRCHAPDLPGIHRSQRPADFRFDFDGYADWVDALVTELNLQLPITLICHDWGAIYGMLWASKYPHKVKRVVAGDFPFSPDYRWHEWARIWQTPLLGELSMLCMNWPLFRWEFRRSSKQMTREEMRACYQAAPKKLATRWTVLKMYRSAAPRNFGAWQARQKQLSEQVPIDLIWGENDVYVGLKDAHRLSQNSLTVIPNCGHWPPVEVAEKYAQIVLNRPTD